MVRCFPVRGSIKPNNWSAVDDALVKWQMENPTYKVINARLHTEADEVIVLIICEERDSLSKDRKLSRKQKKGLDTPIKMLKYPTCRPYHCLLNGNIQTVRELVQKTEEDLLKIKNLGRKSLNDIKGILKQFDLKLGMRLD